MEDIEERRSLTVCKIAGPMKTAPILVWVSAEEVGIRMPIDRFVQALASEVGSPVGLMTQARLQAALSAAAERVIQSMKEATKGA